MVLAAGDHCTQGFGYGLSYLGVTCVITYVCVPTVSPLLPMPKCFHLVTFPCLFHPQLSDLHI